MPFQSLDLTLDPASDALLRAGWTALTDAGITSEGERVSDSHRPHLTALAAAGFRPELLELAGRDLGALLPMELPVSATVVFGRSRLVVAHLLSPGAAVREVIERLRDEAGVTEPWVPHLTLSRKVTAEQLAGALHIAAETRPATITIDALRHWNPETRIVAALATS